MPTSRATEVNGSSKNRKMLIAPVETARTRRPAVKTPAMMAGIANLSSMPKSQATRLPVQAPVPGDGMATKANKAQRPYRSIFAECLTRVCSKSRPSMRLKKAKRFINQLLIGSKSNKIGRTGAKLPSTARVKTSQGLRPKLRPTGIPARSSPTGSAETKKTKSSFIEITKNPLCLEQSMDKPTMKLKQRYRKFNRGTVTKG